MATHDMTGVRIADVVAASRGFIGDIEQVPPMVSAVKIGGRRLHALAREGIEIDRPPRRVHVARFEVSPITGDAAAQAPSSPLVCRAVIDCSSGTYVRSLAADLGRALGGGAHLRALRRTRVGPFVIDEASPLDELKVWPMREAMRGTPTVTVDATREALVRNGRMFDRDEFGTGTAHDDDPFCVLSVAGDLLAVYSSHGPQRVKPVVVLVPS
jgi:tRNA pseudouridine55 synthase